jgi:hypothetical protein
MTIHLRHPASYGFLTYKNLLLTMWASSHLGWSPDMVTPMEMDAFRSFFIQLFPAGDKEGTGREGRIPEPMRQSFLDWLSAETGLKAFEINAQLGASFSELFEEIEGELGVVAADRLDPRFVNLFLLEQPQQE